MLGMHGTFFFAISAMMGVWDWKGDRTGDSPGSIRGLDRSCSGGQHRYGKMYREYPRYQMGSHFQYRGRSR